MSWAEPALRRRRLLGAAAAQAAAALALPGCAGGGGVPGASLSAYPPLPPAAAGQRVVASDAAWAAVAALGRGINFGNMLDAPHEGDWGLRVEERFIDLVGEGGLTRSVRLPVRWSNHASADAQARIDPVFFDRVAHVVDRLLARGATVVLNMHHYRQLDGDALDKNERPVAPEVVQLRLLAMWRQIAERFANRPAQLLFEVYNEPHGALEPHWNTLFARALAVVRTSNPTRLVVVGPTHWNAASHLDRLVLPADRHLVLTVHHYEPFAFTHQGAEWVQPMPPLGQDCCNPAQRQAIEAPLQLAAQFRDRLGYPVFVGEFGAHGQAPLAARLRYLRLKRDAMERLGLPWFYWELAAGFGVYDPMAKAWRTEVRDALFGA